MNGYQLVASLIDSLAWPAVAVGLVIWFSICFRQQVAELFDRLTGLKAGPVEATLEPVEKLRSPLVSAAADRIENIAYQTLPEGTRRQKLTGLLDDFYSAATTATVSTIQGVTSIEPAEMYGKLPGWTVGPVRGSLSTLWKLKHQKEFAESSSPERPNDKDVDC